ncbi:hypothetical protein K439DRAFT_871975 [Ramaria rubella]|nr:hypothetical protein K439DRAFT_871975 [Ramaria rubella]
MGQAESVIYSAIETIPGIGTLYAVPRAFVYALKGDGKEVLRTSVNIFQGVVRDTTMLLPGGMSVRVAIAWSALEALTDSAIDTWFENNKSDVAGRVPEGFDETRNQMVLFKEESNNPPGSNTFLENLKRAPGETYFVDNIGVIYEGNITYRDHLVDALITVFIPANIEKDGEIITLITWNSTNEGINRRWIIYGLISECSVGTDSITLNFHHEEVNYYRYETTLEKDLSKMTLKMLTKYGEVCAENVELIRYKRGGGSRPV